MELDLEELEATRKTEKSADEMFKELGYKRKSLGIYDELNIMYAKEEGTFINFIPRT